MPVVDVGIVLVGVRHRGVGVVVRVRLDAVPAVRVRVLVVRVVGVVVCMGERFVRVLVRVVTVRCSQTPAAMSALAAQKAGEVGSWKPSTAIAAPTKGAVEKYAPVRAVPSPRSASTKHARLMP